MPDLRRRAARAAVAALTLTALTGALAPAAADAANSKHGRNAYSETLLVSDRASDNAVITDPTLVNPWGVALTATSPLWVNKEETALSTLYRSSAGTPSVTQLFSVATVPNPRGHRANPTGAFLLPGTTNPARFIFDSLSGQISAWTNVPVLAPTDTSVVTEPGAEFTGLAISADAPGGPRFYAADNGTGVVRMYDGAWQPVGARDPNLPPKMTPYGIQVIRRPALRDVRAAGGLRERTAGRRRRLHTQRPTDQAARHRRATARAVGSGARARGLGSFGGDLLVGNEDGGAINAFDSQTGHFEGTVSGANGAAIAHDGLWASCSATARSARRRH